MKSGGFRRDSILADAFEAVIAAIYADAGWVACRDVVRQLFMDQVNAGAHTPKDAKTQLQELLQARNLALPAYELVVISGEEHARLFDVRCHVDTLDVEATGSGSSRRAAEQAAAEQVLAELKAKLNER